jgi:hypothetical protein
MKASGRGAAVTLAEGLRRFERWRRSSRRGRHITEELWSLAVGLAGEHGVSKTASTLRLEYYALKRRLAASAPDESSKGRPAFVEVSLGSLVGAPACCVAELTDARGLKLRVELPEQAKEELGSVVRALWEAAR